MPTSSLRPFVLIALASVGLPAVVPSAARAEVTVYANSMEPIDWGDFFLYYAPDSGQTITQSSQAAHTGSHSALFGYTQPGVSADEYLVTPALDLSGHAVVSLSFWESQEWWTGFGGEHQVCVSTTVPDDPAAYTTVLSMTPQDHPIPDNQWQQVTVDLSAFGGQPTVYVALRYQGEDADDWYVDDLLVTAPFRHNVGIASYVPPPWPGRLGLSFDHGMTISNTGTEPLVGASLHWNLTDPQGNIFAQETRDLSGLGPGQDQAYTFAASPTLAGFYASQAWVETQGDEDPGDDAVAGGAWAYSRPRTSVGMLGFSADHAPSQEAEYPFDVFPEIADNTLGLIRLPSPLNGDPFALYYTASLDIDHLRGMTGRPIPPSPPEFDADNLIDDGIIISPDFPWKRRASGWAEVPATWLALAQGAGAPLSLTTGVAWGVAPDWGLLNVTVEIVDDLKPGVDYVLYCAEVEDDASGSGHDQVLRVLFPDTDGLVIDPTPGVAEYSVGIVRAEEWLPANLRLVTFVVERNGDGTYGPIVNGDVRWWLDAPTAVDDTPVAAARTRLVGNAPNPFNPATVITYELARDAAVTLEVFDLAGRLVRRLEAGVVRPAGRHQARWDGLDQAGRRSPSGTYFCRLDAGDQVETRSMLLVK